MRKLFIAALVISLSGCAGLTSLTTQTQAQVNTLADAEQAVTVANIAGDTFDKTGNHSVASINEVGSLLAAVNTALNQLEAAQQAGGSLTFASFNAALSAYNAYLANPK